MAKPYLHIAINAQLGQFSLALDLKIASQVTGIFGPSGAGKTSFFKCLAGLHRHATGRITFNNAIWLDSRRQIFLPPEKRGIGYVPQEGLLFPNKNVRQNLLVGSSRLNTQTVSSTADKKLSLASVCDLLELTHLLTRKVDSLSGGERQRVALGRAILSNPDLLLLDEPLASLDITLRRKILPFLQRIREQLNIPMILISHNPREIQALCDSVLVMTDGKQKVFGEANQVMLAHHALSDRQDESYENILPAWLCKKQPSMQVSHLTLGHPTDGPLLITKKVSDATLLRNQGKLLVGIPARDIILAKTYPHGISAQNILAAHVKTVQCIGNLRMVTTILINPTASHPIEITVELSAQGWESLALSLQGKIYLVIKTTSCILYQ